MLPQLLSEVSVGPHRRKLATNSRIAPPIWFGEVFLDKMDPWNRDFPLVRPASAEFANATTWAPGSALRKAGHVVLSEALTYPGAPSISAQLGLKLIGLAMDDEGIEPTALVDTCEQFSPKPLYLNPTLLKPTTHTISTSRQIEIADIARRFNIQIVEDDPYGFLPANGPAPFATLAPDLTWDVAGLAKCLGAGLRIAYVGVPDVRSGWLFASSVRTATVMASPVTIALATHWINDGTADALLAAVRREPMER